MRLANVDLELSGSGELLITRRRGSGKRDVTTVRLEEDAPKLARAFNLLEAQHG